MSESPAVAVLAGGFSSEREVSLRSGRAVEGGLRRAGYRATFVDVRSPEIPELSGPFDVFFIALHGRFGEDGALQEMLEEAHLAYTGCGPEASRLAMDKLLSKEIFIRNGIPTPPFFVVRGGDGRAATISRAGEMGWPLVVKPPAEGSSVGVTMANNPEELWTGLRRVFASSDAALVERRIVGRELNVGILGCAALPLVEVRPGGEFYDYAAKYQDAGTVYTAGPELSGPTGDRVRSAGLAAFKALGCRDFSRVDVILDGEERVYVLEVNTIPGFTEKSLLPKAAEAAGISFEALCDRIVKFALARASAVHGTSGSSGRS